MAVKGIDVSRWQGKIDWSKVKKAGIKFAILQAGYGREISQKDPTFEYNYKNAKSVGLQVGCYWYSYAVSKADAVVEAEACLQAIKGKKFDFPVYYDVEEQSQFSKGKTFVSGIITAFHNRMKKGGYDSGLYISRSPLESYVTDTIKNKYSLWIAEYNGKQKPNYSGKYDFWQYTSNGKVSGIDGFVDMDMNYRKSESATKKTSTKKTTTTKKEPVFTAGKEYTLQTEVFVRKGAGTNFAKVGYSKLTYDGKKHDSDKDGALDKGTKVTCLNVKKENGNIWLHIPSGWVCGYYKGEVYIK